MLLISVSGTEFDTAADVTPGSARILRNAAHTRRFTITSTAASGWEVRDEQDSRVLHSALYTDWHRVERAKLRIELQVSDLEQRGWRS